MRDFVMRMLVQRITLRLLYGYTSFISGIGQVR